MGHTIGFVKPREDPPHYDDAAAVVRRRVFADPAIHRIELATLFNRAWLFVGPANWLIRPGDFITARMGDEAVIVWRGADGQIGLFANLCPFGSEPLVGDPRGQTHALVCPCHGLAFGAGGARDGVRALDAIAKVACHRGLMFANRDPDALAFEAWLGEFGWYLDLFVPATGVEAYGDDCFRWTVEANWKLPVLSGCGDATGAASDGHDGVQGNGAQIALPAGALAVTRTDQRGGDDPRDGLVPLIAALFPNLLFNRSRHSLDVVHPIGPTRCEVHSYCLVTADMPAAAREAARRRFQFLAGPGGIESGELAEHWRAATAGARAGRHRDQTLSLHLGLGQDTATNLPGTFAPLVSEANQRRFFGWWQSQLRGPAHTARRVVRMAPGRTR